MLLHYNTSWKDGKPHNDSVKNKNKKVTPNALKNNSVNVVEEVPWCVDCQSPHSPNYYVVAQLIGASYDANKEDADEKNPNSMACNMVGSGYEYYNDLDFEETNLDVNNQR